MTDILDTIDNAIADHELSADAMRWVRSLILRLEVYLNHDVNPRLLAG